MQYPAPNALLLSSLITAARDDLTVLHMYIEFILLGICNVVITTSFIKNFFMWTFGFVISRVDCINVMTHEVVCGGHVKTCVKRHVNVCVEEHLKKYFEFNK